MERIITIPYKIPLKIYSKLIVVGINQYMPFEGYIDCRKFKEITREWTINENASVYAILSDYYQISMHTSKLSTYRVKLSKRLTVSYILFVPYHVIWWYAESVLHSSIIQYFLQQQKKNILKGKIYIEIDDHVYYNLAIWPIIPVHNVCL